MRIEVAIEGMLAVHAKHAVFTALGAVAGITRAEVELGRALVEVEGSADPAALRAGIQEAVEAAGFRVAGVTVLPRSLPTL
ncbi:MAG: heavy-metal-associated domain-containing protein [Gemmatimonadales bacterium]|nr:heavy-metal-associated domain-containing protein [Gemmatimonadales bacterium]